MASWIASIEVYVRVALGGDAQSIAYLPGKIGRTYAKDVLLLPEKRTVQIANFLGDALDFTQKALIEEQRQLDVLWLVGHPGKLAKVLDGVWDTHSSRSGMAMGCVARVAAERGFAPHLVQEIENANTVEAAMERLKNESGAQALWVEIERRIGVLAHERVPAAKRIEVRLFDLHGNALGCSGEFGSHAIRTRNDTGLQAGVRPARETHECGQHDPKTGHVLGPGCRSRPSRLYTLGGGRSLAPGRCRVCPARARHAGLGRAAMSGGDRGYHSAGTDTGCRVQHGPGSLGAERALHRRGRDDCGRAVRRAQRGLPDDRRFAHLFHVRLCAGGIARSSAGHAASHLPRHYQLRVGRFGAGLAAR